jgi:hypothetical protein
MAQQIKKGPSSIFLNLYGYQSIFSSTNILGIPMISFQKNEHPMLNSLAAFVKIIKYQTHRDFLRILLYLTFVEQGSLISCHSKKMSLFALPYIVPRHF